MAKKINIRKHLCADALTKQLKSCFDEIHDHRAKNTQFSLPNVLMSAYAMFSLKCGSLLQFDKQRKELDKLENIKSLFKVENVPCDSQMRNILDEVDPEKLRLLLLKYLLNYKEAKFLRK